MALVAEIRERGARDLAARFPLRDCLLEIPPAKVVPESAHGLEPFAVRRLLRLELVDEDPRLVDLAVHIIESVAPVALEFGELLLALAIFLLPRQLGGELLQPS